MARPTRRPFRPALALAILIVSGLVANAAVAATRAASAAATEQASAALDPAALERALQVELREATRALGTEVDVEIADLRVVPDSVSGLALDGVGRMRAAGGEWVPLRFSGGYDLERHQVFGLRAQPIARRTSASVRTLETGLQSHVNGQVAARVLAEFADQPAEIVFVDVQPTSAGLSHVAFRGNGLVQFAGEGAAPLHFSAILDRHSGLLLTLDYQLEVIGAHGDASEAATIAAN